MDPRVNWLLKTRLRWNVPKRAAARWAVLIVVLSPGIAAAQTLSGVSPTATATVHVRVSTLAGPLAGAIVSNGTVAVHTDAGGEAELRIAPVVVNCTRIERRVEDEPLRVEVLVGEDVGEKTQMHPADLRLLLDSARAN